MPPRGTPARIAYNAPGVKEHCYSVYIVCSRTRVLYIGMTSDLQYRVSQHKNGTFEGFTKKYNCHYLVYFERYDKVFARLFVRKN